MLYKKSFEVDNHNPYINDLFNRKKSADILTNLILSTNKTLVLTIDSEWGTGKTSFIKMWQQDLNNREFETLYFNAWESDFVEEPFIAFINEFEHLLKEHPKLEMFKTKSKEVIKGLLPLGVKLLTHGILDIEGIKFDKNIENHIVNYSEKLADVNFKNYRNTKNAMRDFKELLVSFVNESYEKSNKPIIFFVDELDRCRPIFAINLLEKIKHLFCIDNLVFVVAVDKLQLGYSIKTIYGNDMNVEGYLARFIDLEYKLPDPEKKLYVKYLFNNLDINDIIKSRPRIENNVDVIKDICCELFHGFNFSLRIQEKLISRFNIILRTTSNNSYIYPILTLLLLSFKKANLNLYRKICNYEVPLNEILEELNPIFNRFNEKDYINIFEALLMFATNNNEKIKIIRKTLQNDSDQLTNETIKRYKRIDELFNYFCEIYSFQSNGILSYLYNKIEISDNFLVNR